MNHVRYQPARLWLWLCLLALAPFQVAAQSTDRISAAEFGRLWGPALDPAGATQVRNYPIGPSYPVTATPSITAETGGSLSVSKSARFPVDSSRVIDVTAKAAISKAAMGKAFRAAVGLAGGPVGLGLFAASEILNWMNTAGMRQSSTNPAAIEIYADASTYTATCGGGAYTTSGPGVIQAVANGCAANYTQLNNFTTYPNCVVTGVTYGVQFPNQWGTTSTNCGGNFIYSHMAATLVSSSSQWVTPSSADLEYKASSPATFNPSWLTRLLDSGVTVDASNPTLTGPSSVAGPSTTSSELIKDAAGVTTGTRTVTNSSTYNVTYNGNTYNVNQVTTITTVNPDGTSTVKTDTATKPADKPQPTDCDKFPDSAGCVSLGTPTSDVQNKKTSAVSVVATTFASSSACPAPLSFTVRGSSYGFSYQPLCDRLAILKVLFLAIAAVISAFILAETFKV